MKAVLFHGFFASVTVLILVSPILIKPIWTIRVDPGERFILTYWVLLPVWLLMARWAWYRFNPEIQLIRWLVIVAVALIFVWVSRLVTRVLYPVRMDREKLVELGVTRETYRNLPLEEQLEVFIQVAPYEPSHPAESLEWMAEVIGEKGPEMIEPVTWTIRAYLPLAQPGDKTAIRITSWLTTALYGAVNHIRSTEAERLLVELACDTRYRYYLSERSVSYDILHQMYPGLVPLIPATMPMPPEVCRELGGYTGQ